MHLRHPVFYFTDKDGLRGGKWSVASGVKGKGGKIEPDVVLSYEDLPDRGDKDYIADPFFIKHNSRYYLFVEYYHNYRGKVAYFESGDFKNWEFKNIVLEEKFHISYPQVFKDNDEIYMLPEASKSNKLTLYKAVDFPDKWERHSVLLQNIKVLDPTLVKIDGFYYIFFVDARRIQRVYISNELHTGWKEHKSSPLGIGNLKRPGGRIFKEEGKYFLPVQNAKYGYGSSLEKQCIEVLTPGKIKVSRRTASLLKPFRNRKFFLHGTHHLDMQESEGKMFYVLDGRGTEKKSIFVFQLRASIVKNIYDILDLWGLYKFM